MGYLEASFLDLIARHIQLFINTLEKVFFFSLFSLIFQVLNHERFPKVFEHFFHSLLPFLFVDRVPQDFIRNFVFSMSPSDSTDRLFIRLS